LTPGDADNNLACAPTGSSRGSLLDNYVKKNSVATTPGSEGLSAFLHAGCEITGTCRFGGKVLIEGHVSGEIISPETVMIGGSGIADAGIRSRVLLVSGVVNGDVVVAERVEIGATGRINGNVVAPVLIIEEGGVLDGECSMPGDSAIAGVTVSRAPASPE
jgi:cytoskeletal protein CcmA (bactofilin family)